MGKNRLYILTGLGLLIIASYMDNARGPLLAFLKHDLELSYSKASLILVMFHAAALTSTILLIPALNRFFEESVLKFAALGAGAVCLGAFLVQGYYSLLLFSAFVGGVTTLMGTMSNVMIIRGASIENRGRYLSLLHVMYGLGSAAGTLSAGYVLGFSLPWAWGYGLLIPAIALLIAVMSSDQRARSKSENALQPERQSVELTLGKIIILFIIGFYVAGEVLTSMWMTTFITSVDHTPVADAALIATGFFFMMALSRMICFFWMPKHLEQKILVGCLTAAIGFLAIGLTFWRPGLAFAGVLGPFFPLFMSRASHLYPTEWRALTVYIIFALQLSLTCTHISVGLLSDHISVGHAYWAAPIFLALAIAMILIHVFWENQRINAPES